MKIEKVEMSTQEMSTREMSTQEMSTQEMSTPPKIPRLFPQVKIIMLLL
jgi:hypothetical protein